ncbi:MAG TPA: S9 family peptidase [Burkholderiales bacterium]|nr:S9 family peptidase [Burkholderiales bacterium]
MIRFLLSGVLAVLPLAALAQPIPVEDILKRPTYSQVRISPDGRRLAAIVRGEPNDRLAIIDLDNRAASKEIARFADADVRRVFWTTSGRLLFSVGEAYEASGEARFYGWYAINADGSDLHSVNTQEEPSPIGSRIQNPQQNASRVRGFSYLGPAAGGGDNIVVTARRRLGKLDVYRYDTKTGAMQLLSTERPADNITRWLVDRNDVPRVALSHDPDTGVYTWWYRDATGPLWRKMDEGKDAELRVFPIAFDYEGTLYVAWREEDKTAIHRYDAVKRRPGERVARHLDVDMDRAIFSRAQRKLLGFEYDADKRGWVWVDEHMAKMQQSVNAALPNAVNEIDAADENPSRALIISESDVSPPEFHFLDMQKKSMVKVAASQPWIKPAQMSQRKFVRYKARDGLDIPAYLTIPRQSAGGKNLPLIVLIHGGPWQRKQTWDFEVDAQFYASRGYAVLQPDFRGTRGYGWRHYSASFGEWGLAMQDDITDGVEWLIREGIADKSRVCLFGVRYGGYAALWGLMKTPELFRCGIAAFPVVDIEQLYEFNANNPEASDWYHSSGKIRIGDPKKDREKFRNVSPLHNTNKLKAPVLLMFGDADEVVPLKYGTAFRSALDRDGKKYEWIVYRNEGHGVNKDENRYDFYRRVDAFLKQHVSAP